MLRRALLLLLLAAPLGALADVTFTPLALGKNDCGSTSNTLTLNWTSTVTETGQTFAANSDVYRIMVSQTSACPTNDSTTQQIGADQTATALTQTYQLSRSDFLTDASIACGTAHTVYVCISLYATGGSTLKGSAVTGSIKYDLTPPAVPVNVSVAPGDSALYVSWNAGTSTGVAADHYEVTVSVVSGTDTGSHGAQSFTGTSGRYTGLKNGVTYAATVVAVSAAGNSSAASASASGTPAPVSDYWAQYKAQGGQDPGGCGGPAGALSLLGLAALARTFRRRS